MLFTQHHHIPKLIPLLQENPSNQAPSLYFQCLDTGDDIRYRKLVIGEGSWVVRWRDESGKQNNSTLGIFETFDGACKSLATATVATADFILAVDDASHVVATLKPILPPDALLCTDSRRTLIAAAQALKVEHPPVNLSASVGVDGP